MGWRRTKNGDPRRELHLGARSLSAGHDATNTGRGRWGLPRRRTPSCKVRKQQWLADSRMPSHPLVTRLTRSPEDQPAAPAARYSLAHADGPESSSVFGRTPAPKVPAMLGGRCQSAGSTILQCTLDSSFMWTHFSQHQEEGVDSDGRGSAHGRNSAWPFRMKHFSTR